MKKYLLPEGGRFYKANLHSHSTVSDGKLTPEEMKRIYVEKGYSIIAYTDHNVLISHADLADEDFLPLNGYEIDITENIPDKEFPFKKTCHLCFIALEPDNLTQVCFHRQKYYRPKGDINYKDFVKYDDSLPDYERVYTPECINDIIRTGRENGFFVTYNHPTWSMEDYPQYSAYEGMNAMEICNFGCVAMGYEDYNPRVYDDLLRQGKRIYCISTDDNHNGASATSRRFDSFGGFTMIKADKLDYKTITAALSAGNFYASQGPEIYDLWVEDGEVHITCSEADKIELSSGGIRRCYVAYGNNGETVTEASFKITPEMGYFRLTVTDRSGKHANTNAYFTDGLFN